MPSLTRLGDNSTGHDICAATALVTASSTVFVNGKGAGRVGDQYASHACRNHPAHQDIISSGSSTVFVNGISSARVGDPVTLAGSVQGGSGDVLAGG